MSENDTQQSRGHGFGTGPVFLASISTILGAVMFLRWFPELRDVLFVSAEETIFLV